MNSDKGMLDEIRTAYIKYKETGKGDVVLLQEMKKTLNDGKPSEGLKQAMEAQIRKNEQRMEEVSAMIDECEALQRGIQLQMIFGDSLPLMVDALASGKKS